MNAVQRAINLFRRFHKRAPRDNEIMRIDARPQIALTVGELTGVIYKSSGDGKSYSHRFKRARPVLAISHDGSQAYILAGEYRFTERGFVEKGE